MKLHTLLCITAALSGLNGSFGQEPAFGSETITHPAAIESTNAGIHTATEKPAYTRSDNAIVAIGSDARSKGERAEAVVAIGGNAYAGGQVGEAVVAIFGDAYASNDVGEAVVALFGNAQANGRVGEAVVAVLGNAHAEGEVREGVVAVLGNVSLGSNAIVHHDVVAIGGTVTLAEGAEVKGQIQEIAFAIPGLPHFQQLPVWIRECLFKLRLLSLSIVWPWLIAAAFLLIYFLVAVVFPKPVEICRAEIGDRPATTFFVGLLTKILLPVLTLVLAATGIGLIALPFIFAAALFAGIIGKVAMLQYLGSAFTRMFGLSGTAANLMALLIGSTIVLGLYLIPIVGFAAYAILGTWALGAAITALFNCISREKPHPPVGPPPAGTGTSRFANPPADAAGALGSFTGSPAAPLAVAYPRAGFWERMGAAFLDLALLAIPFGLIGPFAIPLAFAYFAGMWTWKGTTIGGLILRHQIVRNGGGPVTFSVAIVRGVAAMFSALVLFLGFFWIGWNREKQGWHDMIAGTYVVRLPQPVPLICL